MKSLLGEITKLPKFSGGDEASSGTHIAPDNFYPLTEVCPGPHSLSSFGHGYYGRLGNGSSGSYDILSPSKVLCFDKTETRKCYVGNRQSPWCARVSSSLLSCKLNNN